MVRIVRYVVLLACITSTCLVMADRPILLVTPQGIYQADVTNGIPQNWRPIEMDVIVRGFETPDPGPTPPVPPVNDVTVQQVSAISKAILKDKDEATAAAAIVNSLSEMGLTGAKFKKGLETAMQVADGSLNADGRLISWADKVLAVTTDAAKIEAGTKAAFGISAATIDAIISTAMNPSQPVLDTSPAFDFAMIIAIIKAIMVLLEQLGII